MTHLEMAPFIEVTSVARGNVTSLYAYADKLVQRHPRPKLGLWSFSDVGFTGAVARRLSVHEREYAGIVTEAVQNWRGFASIPDGKLEDARDILEASVSCWARLHKIALNPVLIDRTWMLRVLALHLRPGLIPYFERGIFDEEMIARMKAEDVDFDLVASVVAEW